MDAFPGRFLCAEMKNVISIILLLFFVRGVYAQKTIHIPVKETSKDSIDRLIEKNKLLQTILISGENLKQLTGKMYNDTLYIYIQQKKFKVLQKNLRQFMIAKNDSLVKTGQLFNKIKPYKILLADDNLHLYYKIEQSGSFQIDSIVYNTPKFPVNLQSRLLQKYRGKPINKINLDEIQKYILYHSKFSIKTPATVSFFNHKKLVRVDLNQPPNNSIEGFFGFAYEAEAQKLQFQGSMHASLYNVLFHNESMSFKWERVQQKQMLDMRLVFPYIFSTRFGLDNILHMSRQDTLQSFVYNKFSVFFSTGKQQLQAGFVSDRKNADSTTFHRYLTFGYAFRSQHRKHRLSWSVNLDYDTRQKSFVGFAQIDLQNTLYKQVRLHHQLNWMYNKTGNILTQTEQLNNFYRRFNRMQSAQQNIAGIKNELIWHKTTTDFYLIGDLITEKYLDDNTGICLNTGIGIKFLKKNQNLTFEIIKPIANTYYIDNQQVYFNIRQQILF